MQYYTASIRNHIQASKVVWKLQKDCPCCYIVESRYFLVISVPQFCSLPLTANTSKKANPCSQVVLLPAKFACLFHIVRHVQIVLVGCLNWESVEAQSLVKVSCIQASPDKKNLSSLGVGQPLLLGSRYRHTVQCHEHVDGLGSNHGLDEHQFPAVMEATAFKTSKAEIWHLSRGLNSNFNLALKIYSIYSTTLRHVP